LAWCGQKCAAEYILGLYLGHDNNFAPARFLLLAIIRPFLNSDEETEQSQALSATSRKKGSRWVFFSSFPSCGGNLLGKLEADYHFVFLYPEAQFVAACEAIRSCLSAPPKPT
jgi:hypothetical protein